MPDYRVILPAEKSWVIRFVQDGHRGVALVNRGLTDFEPKVVFSWHLSVVVQLQDCVADGMPSKREQEVVDSFGEILDSMFKGDEPDKPNALFLARITWNRTRELVYRVYEPERVNDYLSEMIEIRSYPRPFDFRIDPDPEWKLAEWHLKKRQAEPGATDNPDDAQ